MHWETMHDTAEHGMNLADALRYGIWERRGVGITVTAVASSSLPAISNIKSFVRVAPARVLLWVVAPTTTTRQQQQP